MISSDRVYTRFLEASLRVSMSIPDAQRILGVGPDATPEEVSKAWKTKAKENHPDRGGSTEKMVEINIAKEILDGKRRPDSMGGGWSQPAPERHPPRPVPKVVETVPGRSVAEALSAAGVPASAVWAIVTPQTYAGTHSGDNRSLTLVVAVRELTPGVIQGLGLMERASRSVYDAAKGGLIFYETTWDAAVAKTHTDLGNNGPKLIKGILGQFSEAKPKSLRSWMLWGKPLTSENVGRIPNRGPYTFKAALIEAGLAQPEPGNKPKPMVEITATLSREREKRMRQKKPKIYLIDQFDFTVTVGSKSYPLADDTIENFSIMLTMLFKNHMNNGTTINVSKLRGGMMGLTPSAVMEKLVDCLTNEPSDLIIALSQAAEDLSPAAKTAAVRHLVARGIDPALYFYGI